MKGFTVLWQFERTPERWQQIAEHSFPDAALAVAEAAVREAESHQRDVTSIAITNEEGFVYWLWERGRGLTYPRVGMRREL